MSVPECLFLFQDLDGLTEVFGRMSAGTSGPKRPLWADFSFQKYGPGVGNSLPLQALTSKCVLLYRLLGDPGGQTMTLAVGVAVL